jgi:hypothetical protein
MVVVQVNQSPAKAGFLFYALGGASMLLLALVLYYVLSIPFCAPYWANRITDSGCSAAFVIVALCFLGMVGVVADLLIFRPVVWAYLKWIDFANTSAEFLAKLNY